MQDSDVQQREALKRIHKVLGLEDPSHRVCGPMPSSAFLTDGFLPALWGVSRVTELRASGYSHGVISSWAKSLVTAVSEHLPILVTLL